MLAGNEVPFIDNKKASITREGDYFTIDTDGHTDVGKSAEKREVHVSNVRWAEPEAPAPVKAKKD